MLHFEYISNVGTMRKHLRACRGVIAAAEFVYSSGNKPEDTVVVVLFFYYSISFIL